ncbi:MAG: ABC transporter ATP-binding protein [Lachnospiraceae bacterium]|jgi:ATP-binding cassette subfamily B protein|nr:ABC transporter ATP-binding protein [Lachnospiraceae bacterium]
MKKIWKSHMSVLRRMWRVIPFFTATNLGLCVLQAVLDTYTMVYTFRVVIQAFEGGRPYRDVLIFLGLLLGANLSVTFLKAYYMNRLRPVAMKKLQASLEEELFWVSAKAELKQFDSPDFYQDLYWCVSHGYEYTEKEYQSCENFCNAFSAILSLFFIVLTIDAVALCLVGFTVTACLWARGRRGRFTYEKDMKLAGNEHHLEYIDKLFYQKEYLKEMRVQGFGGYFRRKFLAQCREAEETAGWYGAREGWLGFLEGFVLNAFPVYILYTGYLIWQVGVTGIFSLADFTSLFTSIDVLKNNLMWVSGLLAEAGKNAMYLEKLTKILEQKGQMRGEEQESEAEAVAIEEIVFDNVSFSYEEEKETLKDISFSMKSGEKLALVGYNGAGKTTLLKLLLGLYHKAGGTVRINGKDISEYPAGVLVRSFACVFQDFKMLPVTIGENVSMSPDYDEEKVMRCLEQSGLGPYIRSLPEGIRTVVTQEYADEGVGVSGGQMQKLALARALYREAGFLILDEPASAMDPASEYEFNRMIKELNQTLLIVSHRLSTTWFMDQIILLESGRIREKGSHEELMARKAEYYGLYRLQAEKYRL